MTHGDIERVAVFRALQVGDLLVAVPALRALRALFPRAHLSLVALPWAQALAARLPWLDGFLPFPGHPQLPERTPEPGELQRFLDDVQALDLDLAVQLHGSGQVTNSLVAQFGARQVAGFHPAGADCPDPRWFLPWPEQGREAERLLRLPHHLGAPEVPLALEIAVLPEDEAEVDGLWSGVGGRPPRYVCVHPGARWRSRRWPPAHFAAVARALHRHGCAIVLTGSPAEAETLDEFRRVASVPLIDAANRTSLGGLAALLRGACLLLSNDTGVAHLAAAVCTPGVIVCSGADARRWAPLDPKRRRMLHHPVPCRPCSFELCPTGHECALGVAPPAVLRACLELLDESVRHAA
jgi:ADP-heptose:LPS heptosyltransferase